MFWRYILLGLTFFNLSCTVNILETFGDTTTNEALLFDAKQLINDGNYSAALDKFAEMTSDYQARREVKSLRASAYLGLCSPMDFIDLVSALGSIGTTRVMLWLMSNFQGGSAARQTNCVAAENLIKSIDDQGVNRTADENLLMAFIAFAKMGAIISRYGDSGTPDGTVDAGFDPCDPADLPAADAREVATGLNIAMDSLENIGGSTVGGDALADATAACAVLPPGYLPLCSDPPQVDTADIDSDEEKGVRTLINESQDVGLGTCTGDAVACACL